MNLLPRDEKFFDYFHQQSGLLCEASSLLLSGLRSGYEGMCNIEKQMEAAKKLEAILATRDVDAPPRCIRLSIH